MTESPTSARRRTRPVDSLLHCTLVFLLICLFVVLCGCTGPTLRALNSREAKIDVYPSGEVRVYGEPIALRDLESTVRRSSTRPQDTILIRLHGDPEGPELSQLRRLVTDQMLRANHYKFNFFSTPLATVVAVGELSAERAVADVQRLIDETEAYREGTYVSPAVQAKPVAISVGEKPEELKVGGERLEEAKASKPANATAKPTQQEDQAALREQWKRQQRRGAGAVRPR